MRAVMSNRNIDEQSDTVLVLSRMNAHVMALLRATTEGSRTRIAALVLSLIALCASTGLSYAQLRGHGGPVRALAISRDGRQALSGSLDTSIIRWSLRKNAAEQVLRMCGIDPATRGERLDVVNLRDVVKFW